MSIISFIRNLVKPRVVSKGIPSWSVPTYSMEGRAPLLVQSDKAFEALDLLRSEGIDAIVLLPGADFSQIKKRSLLDIEKMQDWPRGALAVAGVRAGMGVGVVIPTILDMATRETDLGEVRELTDEEKAVTAAYKASPDVFKASFQVRVASWMHACFGADISADRIERNHRFIEEALELVQANGCTRDEAHQLVDYVFGRPNGELHQEIGGVMVTLAALCLANGSDMHQAGETELVRIWKNIDQIRAKQAAKPKHSPLPQ